MKSRIEEKDNILITVFANPKLFRVVPEYIFSKPSYLFIAFIAKSQITNSVFGAAINRI